MIVYLQAFPTKNYVENGPPGAMYAKSTSGYIDSELYYVWLTEVFEPNTKHLGKRLLIIDGHGSHLTLAAIDKARELGIEMFSLPPHTTHILQPLDVALYGLLKTWFSKLMDKIQIIKSATTRTVTICKIEFSAVFNLALEKTFTPVRVRNAFEVCGIYLFNPHVIKTSRLMPVEQQVTSAVTPAAAPFRPSAPATSGASASNFIQDQFSTIDITAGVVTLTPSVSHPLQGVVPQRLLNIFVTPWVSPENKTPCRVVTTSRWITSDSYREKLNEKERAQQEEQKKKEKRRRIREEKRKVKETNTRSKKQKTIEKKTVAEQREDSDDDYSPLALPPAINSQSPPVVRKSQRERKECQRYQTSSSSSSEECDEEDLCKICQRKFPPAYKTGYGS